MSSLIVSLLSVMALIATVAADSKPDVAVDGQQRQAAAVTIRSKTFRLSGIVSELISVNCSANSLDGAVCS